MSDIKSSILVIDDEKQIRKFLRITLGASGYKVEEAETGEEGVRLTASIKPDLIICDVMMPELDGYGVLTRLRKNPATQTIALIFITAK